MTGLHRNGEFGQRHRHAQRGQCVDTQGASRWPCDWDDVSISQGTPRIARKHQKQGNTLLQSRQREHGPAHTLLLDFWPLQCERINVCFFAPSSWPCVIANVGNECMKMGGVSTDVFKLFLGLVMCTPILCQVPGQADSLHDGSKS